MISRNSIVIIGQLIFFASLSHGAQFQQPFNENQIYDSRIKTARIYREEWNLSQPLIELGSGQKLMLEFDLLDNRYEMLYYSFIHCNKDWENSELFTSDYLEGFSENPIDNYTKSFNTATDYFHYSMSFPNQNARLTKSGNYMLLVHRQGESDKPLLTLRFMINEGLVGISSNVYKPTMGQFRDTHQQVDVTVSLARLKVADPHNEVFTTILQNGRCDNARMNLKADFISPTELRYTSLSGKTMFFGGNEFRQFDIRSLRYQSEFIRDITFDGTISNVNLAPSENREFKPYFFRNDFNGKYTIDVQEGKDPAIDADYAKVYFTLPTLQPVQGGNIYIAGEMTHWKPSGESRMVYNTEKSAYEGSLILKQGWYNYEYVFIPDKPANEERRYYEGSHFETENEYLILVYYKSRGGRYDRLVGAFVVKKPAA